MKLINYVTQNGLKIIFVKKTGFNKKYCGIGTKYGGSNLEYMLDGKKYRTKPGIAHFIEHQLFQMPGGIDSFKVFTDLYASSNAFTTNDKTTYYFKTIDDFYKPLELLLNMYFTPYFNTANVNVEKDIIISEINMYNDDIDNDFYEKSIAAIYPNDDYSLKITGKEEDVSSTEASDLLEAYNAFYTPENSILTIVGDLDENILFEKIEQILSCLKFSYLKPIKLPVIKSKAILAPYEIESEASVSELNFIVRIDELNNSDPILCEKVIGLLDSIMNISTEFNALLLKEKLLDDDLDYQVVTHADGAYILFSAVSKNPALLAKRLEEKLTGFEAKDMNLKVLDLYMKSLKTRMLLKEDSIDFLGDEILSLALEDIDYEKMIDSILNLSFNDFISYIPYINRSLKTYIISNKKNKKS